MNLTSFLVGSMSLMIQQYVDKYQEEDLARTLNELELDRGLPRIKTYDFIVVGGGTAGCLVAGRLSENFNVLLIESGGPPPPQTYNPYLIDDIVKHPTIHHYFKSIPQTNFSRDTGGILKATLGKMLGGSGSHNGLGYNRGSHFDYNNWAHLTGDSSWSYMNMLRYYWKIENFVGDSAERFFDYNGFPGPLTIDSQKPAILRTWFEAGREIGYKSDGSSDFQREGFTNFLVTMKNGERASSYTAFIEPLLKSKRKSLHLLPYSDVDQVLINSDKIAYGVRYKRHGIPQIAHANKEVIISAGTFSSALLLMKSGIGPKSVLEEAAIPVNQDLPGVGQNLRDHAAVVLRFIATKPDRNLLPQFEGNIEDGLNLYQSQEKSGYFTDLGFGPQAFLVSSKAKFKNQSQWPDIQISFKQARIWKDNVETINIPVVITRPQSVGEIGLNTTAFLEGERDDTKLALVDHRLFTQQHDVDVMIEGIKLSLKIMEETKPFKAMNVTYQNDSPESCKEFTFRSDEYWKCHIRERAKLWHHFTGTCKMGQTADPLAVVDSKLRVKGIQKLRVVDASVMPKPTNANTAAPTMVIAEKISQDILKEYEHSSVF